MNELDEFDEDALDDLRGIEVREGEFLVITAEGQAPIGELLARVRARLGMDVVFVSEFAGGRRIIRYADSDPSDPYAVVAGAADPVEETYCHLIVQGRLPQVIPDTARVPTAALMAGTRTCRVGAHLAAPIVAGNGEVFGTVCCFSHDPMPELGAGREHALLHRLATKIGAALGKGRSTAAPAAQGPESQPPGHLHS